MAPHKVQNQDVTAQLTRNGFRFLHRAAEELAASPRDALMHLSAGIELIVKARLAREHWSLVVDQPGSRSLAEVTSGSFKSVGFYDAIQRVGKITGRPLQPVERKVFESVATHRNKLVHFYHDALDDETLRVEVAKEQCRALSIVRRLMEGPWAEAFPHIQGEIFTLRRQCQTNSIYLSVAFEHVQPDLKKARDAGIGVEVCWHCGLEAVIVRALALSMVDMECLVCGGGTHRCCRLFCPDCRCSVDQACPEGAIRCACGHEWSWPNVLAALGLDASATADCWCCSDYGRGSAFKALDGSGYLCLGCMMVCPKVIDCKMCGGRWVGDANDGEDGCKVCPRGKVTWESAT